MNGYLITAICSCLVIIACAIIYYNYGYEGAIVVCTIATVVCIVSGILSILFPMKAKKEFKEFEARRDYIETYYEKGGNLIEDYGISCEVIELNFWLFNAKASQESFGIWSAYYDIDLSNVEPIALR